MEAAYIALAVDHTGLERLFSARADGKSVWQRAEEDGTAARRNNEPRDPAPYAERYGGWRGARSAEDFWLFGYDREDDRLATEASRPKLVGEIEWQPAKRRKDAGEGAAK